MFYTRTFHRAPPRHSYGEHQTNPIHHNCRSRICHFRHVVVVVVRVLALALALVLNIVIVIVIVLILTLALALALMFSLSPRSFLCRHLLSRTSLNFVADGGLAVRERSAEVGLEPLLALLSCLHPCTVVISRSVLLRKWCRRSINTRLFKSAGCVPG